jgi:hypothetical protein
VGRLVLWVVLVAGSLVGLRGLLDVLVSLVMGDGVLPVLRAGLLSLGLLVAAVAASRLGVAPWSAGPREPEPPSRLDSPQG